MEEARFAFGENWQRFVATLSDKQIAAASRSIEHMFGDLHGQRFLDIGSGSGLFSLAAHNAGAIVHSFDYDQRSVDCTVALSNGRWPAEQGSILDREYLDRLGQFDVVYSWGVLHHTGRLWDACANAAALVRPGGRLCIAIYNDQGWKSRYWTKAKRFYNRGRVPRLTMTVIHLPLLIARFALRAATLRLDLERGMSLWRDYLDWLGGYPFEVASIEKFVEFFEQRGFTTARVVSVGRRQGCNEFLFRLGS